MAGKRTGFSLSEIILVVLILGALAFMAVPRFDLAAKYRKQANTVARQIVTGLRRTRMLAIVNAAKHQAGFTLKIDGSSYLIIDDFNDETVDSQTIPQNVTCEGGPFSFGPLGNLTSSGTQLKVSDKDKDRTYTITITSGTGMVKFE